jgi:hypothetical protein
MPPTLRTRSASPVRDPNALHLVAERLPDPVGHVFASRLLAGVGESAQMTIRRR